MVIEVPPRTKDILVLAHKVNPADLVISDSVFSYYDDVLAGYDYAIYDWFDTLQAYGCRTDWWYDVMSYKMVIVDGGWRYDMLDDVSPEFCPVLPVVERFASSQGLVAYFGSFVNLTDIGQSDPPGYYPALNPSMVSVFGVDSLFATGPAHFIINPAEDTDELGGFIMAEATGKSLPNLHYDPALSSNYVPTQR